MGPDLAMRRRRRTARRRPSGWRPSSPQAPTRGLVATKQALHAAAGNTLEAQLDLERDLQRELGDSDDYREGVAAFVAKRPPRFVGH